MFLMDGLRKEITPLLSKIMSNIYVKNTIEENWCSQNIYFLSLENFLLGIIEV